MSFCSNFYIHFIFSPLCFIIYSKESFCASCTPYFFLFLIVTSPPVTVIKLSQFVPAKQAPPLLAPVQTQTVSTTVVCFTYFTSHCSLIMFTLDMPADAAIFPATTSFYLQNKESRILHRASCITRHTSHVQRHTSHIPHRTSTTTRHTPHAPHHTPHVPHHTPHTIHHTSNPPTVYLRFPAPLQRQAFA